MPFRRGVPGGMATREAGLRVSDADGEPSPFKTRQERARERERKLDALVAAAVRLFNRKGFHAASLDDLAAQLGVGKPTIYHYLGNKEQVLFECLSRGLEDLRRAASDAHQTPGSGLDRLRVCLQFYGEVILGEYGRLIVRTGDELLSPDGVLQYRALKRNVDVAIRQLVKEGIADGSLEPGNATIITFTIVGALNWAARWHDPADGPDPGTTVAQIVDVLTRGVARRSAEPARPKS